MNKRIVVWLILVGILPGCCGLAPPNLHYPGTAGYQQARAQVFDPYPENEPGPAIEGGRPLEYERPIPEVDRARRLPKTPPGLNITPIP
ncbi:MAG: membrane or secreted protein [Thermoguttaceae bacterium]|jgi:hypothetical protein|nr:membrane or secreted protein [Thermoguttaceae bacterium]